MEVDLCLPSFCTMRKRSRSRSPTPCEHDRPLVCTFVFWSLFCSNVSAPIQKRSSALALAVGDCAREPPRLSRLRNRRVHHPPHKRRRCPPLSYSSLLLRNWRTSPR